MCAFALHNFGTSPYYLYKAPEWHGCHLSTPPASVFIIIILRICCAPSAVPTIEVSFLQSFVTRHLSIPMPSIFLIIVRFVGAAASMPFPLPGVFYPTRLFNFPRHPPPPLLHIVRLCRSPYLGGFYPTKLRNRNLIDSQSIPNASPSSASASCALSVSASPPFLSSRQHVICLPVDSHRPPCWSTFIFPY